MQKDEKAWIILRKAIYNESGVAADVNSQAKVKPRLGWDDKEENLNEGFLEDAYTKIFSTDA